MQISNKVLARQLKKAKITDLSNVDEKSMLKFLALIQNAYESMDSNVYRLERALEISTSELRNFNDNLEDRIKEEVTKNREKDKTLLEQSRYASMGEMIANIAHQWRQPLSAISTTATSMQVQLELDIASKNDLKDSYNKIVEFTNFLTQTIEDFRGYLKQDKEKTELNLRDIIDKSKNIIQAIYTNNEIELVIDDYTFQTPSFGLENELNQVFLNILNNAKDAHIENNIQNRKVHIQFSEDKEFNTIKIIDNAGGIPDNILQKIYDPYFTTKHQSQGTGIGLYMSKDIIEKNMKGRIVAGNTEDGAIFSISIPKKRDT
jgi:C4-dicarboxylate-specific signal transduction histidine kinase